MQRDDYLLKQYEMVDMDTCPPDIQMPPAYYSGSLSPKRPFREGVQTACAETFRHNIQGVVNTLRQFRGSKAPVFATAYIEDAHDSLSALKLDSIDAGVATALAGLEPFLDNTAIVLVSDHGLHYGKHLESFAGQVEHKLPLLKILLPPKVKSRHPQLLAAFRHNRQALTHHYDVYETLRGWTFFPNQPPKGFGRVPDKARSSGGAVGLSLFQTINYNRTCEDAEINAELCVCGDERPVPLDAAAATDLGQELDLEEAKFVSGVVKKFVGKMNALARRNAALGCAAVSLGKVEGAFTKGFAAGGDWGDHVDKGALYRIRFSVFPQGDGGQKMKKRRTVYETSTWRRGIGTYEWDGGSVPAPIYIYNAPAQDTV